METRSRWQHFAPLAKIYSRFLYPDVQLSEWPLSRAAWIRNQSLIARFNTVVRQMDGLHIHGLWEQASLIAIRAARAKKMPYVLSAHGMLEPWALNNKRFKKQIYSFLIERANVQGASCLHALTNAEADDYRRYGATGPIAVIPNGVEIPANLSSDHFFIRYPQLKGKRIVLFLGRIHFKKGLDILVQAWQQIASRYPDAHLVLAGPDFENTQSSLVRMMNQGGLGNSITFTGMLDAEAKWSAFAAAECFVLPSYSEGLSVSTLEAMGAGLPVILSEHCHLPQIADIEAGIIIRAQIKPLQQALEELLNNSPSTNRAVGEHGRRHVATYYNWQTIASQMSELYSWLAGGDRPASLHLHTNGGAL